MRQPFTAKGSSIRLNHSSTGPTTALGKERAALNAVKHGLAGNHLVLPGENVEQYTSRVDAVFESLAPKNDAEAQLVALVADDLWKLERLGKMEHALLLVRVEQLVAETPERERCARLKAALLSVGEALEGLLIQPYPLRRDTDTLARATRVATASGLVSRTIPELASRAGTCELDLARLEYATEGAILPDGLYEAIVLSTRQLMGDLLTLADPAFAAEASAAQRLQAVALPDERELKKVARYRKLLEEGLQRKTLALESLRKLGAEQAAAVKNVTNAREYRMKLRVVR